MDQPQQGDENTNNENMMPDQASTEQQTTPISVNFENSEPATEETVSQQDSVMEGVPSADDSQAATVSDPSTYGAQPDVPPANEAPTADIEQMIETAEEQVAEAEPQSTDAELAAVASEIETIVTNGENIEELTQPTSLVQEHDSSGSDPMQQILNEADAAAVTADSVNQTGSFNTAAPLTDADLHEVSSPAEDVASEASVIEENPTQLVGDPLVESIASDAPGEIPSNPNNEDVPITVETEPTSVQPNDTLATALAEQENSPETSNEPTVISDVVAPTAVAAAVAAGSIGENAITGTPEPSTVESSQGATLANQKEQIALHQSKSGKGKLIAVVLFVTLLFAGAAIAAFFLRPESAVVDTRAEQTQTSESQVANATETESLNQTPAPGQKVEAAALDDYKAACAPGGLVSNATAYGGPAPHPVVVFEKGADDKYALSLVNFKDPSWSANAQDVESGQLVTCIARKSGSEVKIKSCPITDATTKVTTNVDFFSTKYVVDVIEAQSGKKVATFENSSTSTTCPTVAVYNKADPRIYAGFDVIALETSLTDSVTKSF